MTAEKRCIWEHDEDSDYYDTSCGHSFCFTDGKGLTDKSFKFCPYCGKEIEEIHNEVEVQDAKA